MPIVLTIFGWCMVIYPNDHRLAHVHVIGNGCEAVFNLHCPDGSPELRENYGFSHTDLAKIVSELVANLAMLCSEWRRIHGHY